MATGDLYRCSANITTNNRHWSFGWWMEEQDPISAGGDGLVVAEAIDAQITTELRNCLSSDSDIESYQAYKRFVGFNPGGTFLVGTGDGQRAGDALPNDNCLYLNLVQTAGDAKNNGGMFISGQSASDVSDSQIDATYLSTQVAALRAAFLGNFDAVSPAGGRWTLSVLSQTITPPLTGIGTPLDVTAISATNRILTQSRRRQKARGLAN